MHTNFKIALDVNFAPLRNEAKLQVESGTPLRALNAARKFHLKYPNRAESNFEMARALCRNGKAAEAMNFAETANKINPSNADYIMVLGRIYLDFRLYEYAAPLLREAIKRLPHNMLMHWAMADFLFGVGDGHAASAHYKIALDLKPTQDQKAEIIQNYIKCLSTTDQKAEAENQCNELAKIPGLENRARIRQSSLVKYKNTDAIAADVEAIALDKNIAADLRSTALLSLGNMFNNNKLYDEAFEFWSKSRAIRNITQRQDIGNHKLAQIKGFYPIELFEQAKLFGHSSELPVFVVGMPRSGTTLTEQIIASHPDGFGVGELGRMGVLEPMFRRDYSDKPSVGDIIKNAKNKELQLRAEETLGLLDLLAPPNKKRIVDKMPTQYFDMGYAVLCFPNAKIIHTDRHPADSFVSAFQNNMSQFHEYSFNQELYAETYLAKQAIIAHWRKCFPAQIFDLRYEALVTQPEETVRKMLEFLGLPWDENCMQFFDKGRTVKTLSQDQVRNPIYTSSVYRWKNYEKHLKPLFAALKAANFEYPEI